jgi:hypothetical protein
MIKISFEFLPCVAIIGFSDILLSVNNKFISELMENETLRLYKSSDILYIIDKNNSIIFQLDKLSSEVEKIIFSMNSVFLRDEIKNRVQVINIVF